MRQATLVFLVKKDNSGNISELCLALKKRGFGSQKWNGVGGKVEIGESIESAAKRETKEEIQVDVLQLEEVSKIRFFFEEAPENNQVVTVFLCNEWKGNPQETEEMAPQWFEVKNIPYDTMWSDDIHWLPKVLAGEKFSCFFVFNANNEVLDFGFDLSYLQE